MCEKCQSRERERNREFLQGQLDNILERDPALPGLGCKVDYALIRREFNPQTARYYYLLQLCKSIRRVFQSGEYFRTLCLFLFDILLKDVWDTNDIDNITVASNYLAVELLLKDYSLDTVRDMPRKLFTEPNETKITSDQFESRLHRLLDQFNEPPSERYVIYQVAGLKGDLDVTIGNVNFYSPYRKRYSKLRFVYDDSPGWKEISSDQDDKSECFGRSEDEGFLNAAACVTYVDERSARSLAIETIEKALDLLQCLYTIKTKMEIVTDTYKVVTLDGKDVGGGFAFDESLWLKWNRSLDLRQGVDEQILAPSLLDRAGYILFTPVGNLSEIEQKIRQALHWFRKADEADMTEDKVLNYWIVIEKLLRFESSSRNVILAKKDREEEYSLARELIPPIQGLNFIREVAEELFWYLHDQLYNYLSFRQGICVQANSRTRLSLPQDIIGDCGLTEKPYPFTSRVDLRPLINNLDRLVGVLDRKHAQEKVHYAQKFYNDCHFAKEQIEKRIATVKSDIFMMYWYRNKIVHNAHFDNVILPQYVQKSRRCAHDVLVHLLTESTANSRLTTEEILVGYYREVSISLDTLTKNMPLDWSKFLS